MFWIKPPQILHQVFSKAIWRIPTEEKVIYLTFDDGPHTELTPIILDQLKQYNFSATFFCLGKSVIANPSLFKQLLKSNNGIGLHGYDHLNGWQENKEHYLENLNKVSRLIDSNLFRPPYGKLSWSQWNELKNDYQIIMWSVMPEDFREDLTSEVIFERLKQNIQPGNIVVLHENDKSLKHCKYLLPRYLSLLQTEGYTVKKLPC